MPTFNPNEPQNGETVDADVLRDQFNSLKDLVDAVPTGPTGPPGPAGTTGPTGPADTTAERRLGTSVSSVTIANSTVETSLLGTIDGEMKLAANTLAVGTRIDLWVFLEETTVAGPATITCRLKFNGATVLTTATAAPTYPNTNTTFLLHYIGIVRAIGTTGQIVLTEWGFMTGAGNRHYVANNPAVVAFDSTMDQVLDCTAQYTTAVATDSLTSLAATLSRAS